ncbi:MAG: hypothetical protein K9H26_17580 [Prolixibacteraceae bacterium]|nr:hypothetical protein [Prolixibacteraceae bacterium]
MEEQKSSPVIKIGEWIITILLMAIPVVNIIFLLIWAFGSGTNPTKANFSKAALIWMLIAIVVYVFIALVFGAAFLAATS